MTQLDVITDPIARLEAETDPVSSRPDQRCEDDCDLTEEPEVSKPPRSHRPGSKQKRTKKVMLISMLSRKSGATLQAMMDATGWQAHSLRAALSGLRKSGIAVERRSNRRANRCMRSARQASHEQGSSKVR